MGSAWVEHVKSVYAKGKKGGMSYKQAMQKAKASWAKKKGASSAAPKKKKAASKTKAADDDEKVEKPKRAKKKARKQVVDGKSEQAQDAPSPQKRPVHRGRAGKVVSNGAMLHQRASQAAVHVPNLGRRGSKPL